MKWLRRIGYFSIVCITIITLDYFIFPKEIIQCTDLSGDKVTLIYNPPRHFGGYVEVIYYVHSNNNSMRFPSNGSELNSWIGKGAKCSIIDL